MADPFRLIALKNLTALIEGEDSNSDFTFDLTGRVSRGRTEFGANDTLPLIALLEPPVPIEALPTPQGGGARSTQWDILIQGFAKDDKNHPLDPAYVLSAEVTQRLARERTRVENERRQFGKIQRPYLGLQRITDFQIGTAVHRPADQEVSKTAYFYMVLSLRVTEDLENPF